MIKFCIERPIIVVALLLMLVLGGIVATISLPVQLTPDIRKPIISINTSWLGASPAEVEREIIIPQENELKDLEGLERMESTASLNFGEIEITLAIGTDINTAILGASNRLDQVKEYPVEAGRPKIGTAGSEDNPMAWIMLRALEGNNTPIHHYGKFAEDHIKDRLERINGVARVNVFGGSDPEMRISFDPFKLAEHKLFIPDLIKVLQDNDFSATGGDFDEEKRRYLIRIDGEFNSTERVKNVVIRDFINSEGETERLKVSQVGDVAMTYKDREAVIRINAQPSLAINAIRAAGSNVIEVMDEIQLALEDLNQGILADNRLYLTQVYDETVYIRSANKLVKQNILIGAILAMGILYLFLRSASSMAVIATAIPLSVLGALVAMALLGRSFNVISFAGLAFAVGMVVDAALVVLENTFRLRERGKSPTEAAHKGALQVWMAVMVSTLTTIIVFVPILLLKLEAGQLFRDIAVAISASVVFSLLISLTVVPMLSARIIKSTALTPLPKWLGWVETLAHSTARAILSITAKASGSIKRALWVSGTVSLGALAFTTLFLPKLEYLPEGNANLIFGYILPPPGYNLATTGEIAERVEAVAKPILADPNDPKDEIDGKPAIRHFFFVTRPTNTFLGASSKNPQRVSDLIPLLSPVAFSEPGTFGFINQPSLFGRGLSGGRAIELDIYGDDLEKVLPVAKSVAVDLLKVFPFQRGNQLRPIPGLEFGSPELRFEPDQDALADANINARQFANSIRALTGGIRVNEITMDGDRIDLTLRADEDSFNRTQGVAYAPVPLPNGETTPAITLADAVHTAGPLEIRRLDRQRTVTLELRPFFRIPLEEAVETLKTEVTAPIKANLPPDVFLRVSGYADELTRTWNALSVNFLVSVGVVYLIMVMLFMSFLYPLVIMLSVPVALAGGIMGLTLLNFWVFQPLDMLTMLGFVILTGIVVNNAILIVYQAIDIRETGAKIQKAVLEAVRNRIRPIFMSTLTSLFGMLPLVLFPFEGSELYRGLGAVVLGGLALSSILTLVIVPPVLSLVMQIKNPKEEEPAQSPIQ